MKIKTFINDSDLKLDREQKADIRDFVEKHNNHNLTIEFIAESDVEYHQHKYYNGSLLPSIASAMGETNISYVHLLLKRDFLYRQIETLDDIPDKYTKKGIFCIEYSKLFNLTSRSTIPFSLIRGVIIVVDKDNFVGYIPSNADLTFSEKDVYHKMCEDRLFDLNGCLI